MDTTIVATAIPSIVSDLGGFSLFAWVFSIYTLIQAVTIPICSKLADLYGRKPVLIIGIIIFVIGSIFSGLSWNMLSLIVFRGLQGVGAGVVQPMVTTVAGDLFTIEERGRIQGWISSVWGIAAVIGPAIGGFFTQYASWRWIFYINVPLGALALLMIWLYFHEQVTHQQHRIDYTGAALLAIAIGLLVLGLLSGGEQWAWLSPVSILVFAGAMLALVAFVWQERRAPEPMLPLWVFSRHVLIGSNIATLVLGLLSIGLSTFLPTYAQGVLGVSAVIAGFALAVMSISWPLSSALSSKLYMRIGFRNTALIGSGITLVSSLIFIVLPESTTVLFAALGSFVMGAGLGLLSTPLVVGLQSIIGWNRRGVVTGSNMFARQLGQTIGAAILGSVANAVLANWLTHAPANLAGQLPQTIDITSQTSSPTQHLSSAVTAYVKDGLYLASHSVFLALGVFALVGIVALLLTPDNFKPLHFPEDDQQQNVQGAEEPPIILSEETK